MVSAAFERNSLLVICSLFLLITVLQLWTPVRTTVSPEQLKNLLNEARKSTSFSISDDSGSKIVSDDSSNIGSELKRCIYESPRDLWHDFVWVVNECARTYGQFEPNRKSFVPLHMGRFGEVKYFLPLVEKHRRPKNFTCFWLTIGIGGDSEVEKEFKSKYPECKLYGVEPGAKDQYAEFPRYGTVIPVGVGVEKGELTMRVRVKGNYKFETVAIEPMQVVLDRNLHQRLVHFATLDVEGFEYPLLRALQSGREFEKSGVAFCQLDVELHTPKMTVPFEGGIQKFREWDVFVREFVQRTPYVPVLASTFSPHYKVTLVNPSVSECVAIFDLEKYRLL